MCVWGWGGVGGQWLIQFQGRGAECLPSLAGSSGFYHQPGPESGSFFLVLSLFGKAVCVGLGTGEEAEC